VGEILVLLNGILLVLEKLEASLLLCLEALDGGRSQAVCAEVLANLDGVCSIVVGASEEGVRIRDASTAGREESAYDCLDETAGGLLWRMFAAGAGAIDAEEDIMDEV
jgi:hypothetical protein